MGKTWLVYKDKTKGKKINKKSSPPYLIYIPTVV